MHPFVTRMSIQTNKSLNSKFIARRLTFTNHTDIGSLYFIFGLFSGILGTLLSLWNFRNVAGVKSNTGNTNELLHRSLRYDMLLFIAPSETSSSVFWGLAPEVCGFLMKVVWFIASFIIAYFLEKHFTAKVSEVEYRDIDLTLPTEITYWIDSTDPSNWVMYGESFSPYSLGNFIVALATPIPLFLLIFSLSVITVWWVIVYKDWYIY